MLRVSDSFARTDTGRQRRSNEDAFYAQPPLFAVADGMGGARAGEVAARLMVEVLEDGLPDGGSDEHRLADSVREANARIYELAQRDPERAGMGTTVTTAYVGDSAVAVAHVGDSRAYRLHDGHLEQITRDHSLVEELKRRGKLTEEEAEEHPQKSVITRALGPESRVEVDTVSVPARAGDVFLLCSDGLTGMVPEDRIGTILEEADDLEKAGRALIAEANERGGRDNITVVLFGLEEVAGGVEGSPDGAGDRPTQVGVPAPSAEEVEAAKAAAAPRRTMPLPRREDPAPPAAGPGRRRIRGLVPTLVVVAILAVLGAGAWVASRAVYFVGTTNDGFVAVYRGLPWDGPFGLHLYERYYASGIPASELPSSRRQRLLDHQLRSQDDASDLVRKLEQGQVGQ